MKQVYINDKKYFKKTHITTDISPCGSQPLRIFKDWLKLNKLNIKLICYSNSKYKDNWWHSLKREKFDGVTYASLVSLDTNKNWLYNLESKLLAYSHIAWVKDFLIRKNNRINNGLFWSPLKKLKGSCFVTISDKDDNTMSCFGDSNIREKYHYL